MTHELRPAADGSDPVIAVHGTASTGRQWKQLANDLAPAYAVSAPDLPGYGSRGALPSPARPSLAGDAGAIADIAGSDNTPVHLVAHSYGAAVALRFALDNPDKVKSLTLMAPALFHVLRNGGPRDINAFFEICAVADAVRVANLNGTPERGMAQFVDYWNGAGCWAAMAPSLQAALAPQTGQVARNFAAAMAETWAPIDARRIHCPTLLIAGAASRAPALRVSQHLADAIPQARLQMLPGLSHMAPVTHPHLINPLIADALDAATNGSFEASLAEAA